MDERAIKRLLTIVAVSIIAILIFKSLMLKSMVDLNKVVAEKKQAAATTSAQQQDATPVSDAANAVETAAASALGEVTTLESPAASGVGEGR